MAGLVLDASVAMAWFMPGENNASLDAALDATARETATVPGIWPLEMGTPLLMAERRGRIDRAQRRTILIALRRLPIAVDAETATRAWDSSLRLAERFRLTLYDAAYLELAARRTLPLATADAELRRAGKAFGIALFS